LSSKDRIKQILGDKSIICMKDLKTEFMKSSSADDLVFVSALILKLRGKSQEQ
jgi:hypothetical protein